MGENINDSMFFSDLDSKLNDNDEILSASNPKSSDGSNNTETHSVSKSSSSKSNFSSESTFKAHFEWYNPNHVQLPDPAALDENRPLIISSAMTPSINTSSILTASPYQTQLNENSTQPSSRQDSSKSTTIGTSSSHPRDFSFSEARLSTEDNKYVIQEEIKKRTCKPSNYNVKPDQKEHVQIPELVWSSHNEALFEEGKVEQTVRLGDLVTQGRSENRDSEFNHGYTLKYDHFCKAYVQNKFHELQKLVVLDDQIEDSVTVTKGKVHVAGMINDGIKSKTKTKTLFFLEYSAKFKNSLNYEDLSNAINDVYKYRMKGILNYEDLYMLSIKNSDTVVFKGIADEASIIDTIKMIIRSAIDSHDRISHQCNYIESPKNWKKRFYNITADHTKNLTSDILTLLKNDLENFISGLNSNYEFKDNFVQPHKIRFVSCWSVFKNKIVEFIEDRLSKTTLKKILKKSRTISFIRKPEVIIIPRESDFEKFDDKIHLDKSGFHAYKGVKKVI